MTPLVRWDPFAEWRGLRRAMNRSFYGFPSVQALRLGSGELWHSADPTLTFPVDVSETEDSVIVKAALPGIKPDEVEVSVSDGVLTVKGETKAEEKSEGENYYRREIRYGAFARSIQLPAEVVDEKADAEFKDGVLTVTLPKVEEAHPKTIKVKASATAN